MRLVGEERAGADPVGSTTPATWRLLLIGVVAGLLSGAFGVGGGVLIVPALTLFAGMAQRVAHGTSLTAVLPISVVGMLAYLGHGSVELTAAGLLVLGTVTGALAGVRLLARVPAGALRWLFIGFLVLSAVRLLFEVPSRTGDWQPTTGTVLALVGLGLVTGVLSGLLGVGGGVFLVPVLILVLGMGDVAAKGTSLLAVIPTGLAGTWANQRQGSIDVRAALTIGLAGAPMALAGFALAVWLPPRGSAVLFAVFLLLLSARMALAAMQGRRPGRTGRADGDW